MTAGDDAELAPIRTVEDRLAVVLKARQLLALAGSATDAKKVADMARAGEVYGRLQGASEEAIAEATAIKVDALAVMGGFLKVVDKNEGAKGVGTSAVPVWNCTPTLADTGIPRKQSMHAQAIATVKEVIPDLFARIRSGEAPVSAAHAELKKRGKKAKADAERAVVEEAAQAEADTAALYTIDVGDCLEWLRARPADSVHLVFGSPPYERARLYLEDGKNLGIARDTKQWVTWMVEIYEASLRCCTGLVAFVMEGQTKDYRWSAAPLLLGAALMEKGITLRKPPIYCRVGIPGSGGPDWLRNDYEFILCATRGGRLPWSENTAMGSAPVYGPGGAPSHRRVDGTRVSETPVGTASMADRNNLGPHRARQQAGRVYQPPEIANPGNVIRCSVGGGAMGDKIAHENEAPFPEYLVEFFVRSFCPPGGIVCDPFSGSGTTAAVSIQHGRRFAGCDLRPSQVKIARRRLARVQAHLPLMGD